MDFTSIVTRLNELTTFMNNVVSLSKKIFQLPSSTAGNKLVAVWNESSEQTEQFNLTNAIQGMYTLTDGIKELGTISNVDNDYTFSVGYKWRINGIDYENEETVLNVPDASTGFYRIDIAVVDETNSIYIVSGVESSTLALQPENPPNTLILCVFQIFEGIISNSDPVITQQNNIPLKVNILSSDLSADTVAGFVDYFNDLNPNLLVKETTSIVQFLCTDTNNIYQLTGVGKGLYGLSNLQITTNNVLKFSISGGVPTLPQVLTEGDRETLILEDGLDHVLTLSEGVKYIVQIEPFDIVLNTGIFPDNTEIYIFNTSGSVINITGTANIITANEVRNNSLCIIKKIVNDDTWTLVRIESMLPTPTEIGLGNVDNTSDLDKPISDATQTAIDALSQSVTAQFEGYKIKETVKVLASSNITLSGTQTIDGHGVSAGDRVIANGQTTQTQNGCYVVSSGAWTRASDSDTATELDKALYFVLLGAENGGKIFYQSNAVPGIGTGIALWLPFLTNPTATEVGALAVDGSNANQNIDLGSYNFTANELTSANRINGDGYYLRKVGGKLGLYVTATDAIIAILDSDSGDNIFTYANGNLTYNATTNELKWGSDVIAKMSDIPSLTGYATESYVDNKVAGLLDLRGNHNASGNTYPSSGGSGTAGAILKGDFWYISVAGTLGGVAVNIGDSIYALVDTPGTTSANWAVLDANLSYVAENSSNKTDTMSGNTTSSTKYLSAKGVYDYLIGMTWLTDSIFGTWLNGNTAKTTPVDADVILIGDSSDSNKSKKLSFTNFKSYLDGLYVKKSKYISVGYTQVTGVTSQTVLASLKIPAGTYASGDAFEIIATPNKSVTASAINFNVYHDTALNGTTNAICTAISLSTTQRTGYVMRALSIDSTTLRNSMPASASGIMPVAGTTVGATTTFNPAVDNWITVTVNPSVVSESAGCNQITIRPL
jgi:hypothetical protein